MPGYPYYRPNEILLKFLLMIAPISTQQQQQVRELTYRYISDASAAYQQSFPEPIVLFDLKARAAGMFRVKARQAYIRYNPYIFAKYYQDNLATTVPHEVAHYIVYLLYYPQRPRPHGSEWKQVMALFGADDARCCQYDFSDIPLRRSKKYLYRCHCQEFSLSAKRHHTIQSRRGMYFCPDCGISLRYDRPL